MYDDDFDPAERRLWKWTVIGLVAALIVVAGWIVVGMFHHDLDPMEEVQRMPTVHPVFGSIHMATATDVSEIPLTRRVVVSGSTLNPRNPVPLILGTNTLEWGSADVRPGRQTGYLYLWDTASRTTSYWEIAPCSKPSLAQVTTNDLNTEFFSGRSYQKGQAAFGTNWIRNGSPPGQTSNVVRVRVGQLVLLRCIEDPATIYVLELTRQKEGYLWARYMEVHK